jgi:hypothetical protein
MTTILIILGLVIFILIFSYIKIGLAKRDKNELKGSFEKIQKEIFPNGRKDINEGASELLRILDNTIDFKTAENIFVLSSSICYISNMNNGFNKERLKQHLAPYAIQYFNDSSLSEFYKYLISKSKKTIDYNDILEISRELSQSLGPATSNKDIPPLGKGRFGLEMTNPILAASIADIYLYLDRLRTESGDKIIYQREGKHLVPNFPFGVNEYSIFLNDKQISKVFIYGWSKKTSSKAPEGFKLI